VAEVRGGRRVAVNGGRRGAPPATSVGWATASPPDASPRSRLRWLTASMGRCLRWGLPPLEPGV